MSDDANSFQRIDHGLKPTPLASNDNRKFIVEFGKSLRADYMILDMSVKQNIAEAISEQAVDLEQESVWENLLLPQLWSMELLILKHMPDLDALRRSWLTRERFRVLLGDAVYKQYEDNLSDTIKREGLLKLPATASGAITPEYDLLREDNANISRIIQRLSYFRIKRNESIGRQKNYASLLMLILIVFALGVFFSGFESPAGRSELNLFLLVIYAGMLGAYMSILQRLQQATTSPIQITDSAFDSLDITQGISVTYMISVIVSGAVFALIFYLISMAGIVNIVELLPDLLKTDDACKEAGGLFARLFCVQHDNKVLAKLLIICFMSGFAERLVPDVLDNLVKKAALDRTNKT